jgi:gp16 family phage-associated protein
MVKALHQTNKIQTRGALDGEAIRLSLMFAGLTQDQWAKQQGVSPALVSRLIAGGRPGVRGKSAEVRTALITHQANGTLWLKRARAA